jgi:hypothetical protein
MNVKNKVLGTMKCKKPAWSKFKNYYLCDMYNLKTIEKKINQLPPSLVVKLDDYLDYLLSQKKVKKDTKVLTQTWAGGLKEYKKKYTSIELQKLALEWRTK